MLEGLLALLDKQQTGGRFTFSAVVVDNDRAESARTVIAEAQPRLSYRIEYYVEKEQNIALARNCAVTHASGDYLAFIDDDELPSPHWLARLLTAIAEYPAAAILAPVRPRFESPPPGWAIRSQLFERPEYVTGTRLDWRDTRTGNVLIARSVAAQLAPPFRPEFGGGGEDQDFFRRLAQRGHLFFWCNEAAVEELVPAARVTKKYLLRRALLRGQNEKHQLTLRSLGKSVAAILVYLPAIPLLALVAEHLALKYTVKLFDHAGKLFGAAGLEPMGAKYLAD